MLAIFRFVVCLIMPIVVVAIQLQVPAQHEFCYEDELNLSTRVRDLTVEVFVADNSWQYIMCDCWATISQLLTVAKEQGSFLTTDDIKSATLFLDAEKSDYSLELGH